MNPRIKYPRTPHLPWSPGGTADDAYLADVAHFEGREIVVTEKLDGENTSGQVFQEARERLKEALRKKETVVWDATNLRRDGRRALVRTAHDYGAATEIVRFAVTPAELARRNRKRAHDIPTAVLERQIERFEWPDLWEAQEVTTVRQGSD